MILAGDVGATKAVVGLYRDDSEPTNPTIKETFSTRDFGSLEELTRLFLQKAGPKEINSVCFAVAGPILSDQTSVTNLPWEVRTKALSVVFGTSRVKIINDVEGLARAVPLLKSNDLQTLRAGRPEPGGTLAVIAVGTGLGEAFLTWNGTTYLSHPSEGGHTDFGPADVRQRDLLAFLSTRQDHVSWELVCSGIGIPNIYDFLASECKSSNSGTRRVQFAPGKDRAPVIIQEALERQIPDPLCEDTLEIFVSILGAESGNLALKTLATGGLYLGGGIPPRILKVLEADSFLRAFTAKGRLAPMMEEIPVHVILNTEAALMGAAVEAFRLMQI